MEDFVGRKNLIPRDRMRELTKRSDLRGWIQTISHFGAILLAGTGLYFTLNTEGVSQWWAVPFFCILGILLNYLFAAQHEYNHYTAFKTRWLNDVFNRITGFIQLYPRDYERWYHFEHHRHTQDWDNDPELISRGGPYTLGSYLPYLFGLTYWTGRIQRLFIVASGKTAHYFTDKQKQKVVAEHRWHLAGYALVAAASVYLETWAAVIYWIGPLFTMKVFQNVQNVTEHTGLTHLQDTVHNTRTIKTWWIFRWMAWNMQYHTAHHTFPAVPFFNLPALHAELVKHAGYEPPSTGYLAFQYRFIRQLIKGPETRDGIAEIDSSTAHVEPAE
ncbi:MAG: fatty acid desaturase [Alphaproteobacteria bacterium]|nr:fatty acid desaturase [Alphaproteobacteria bacterium]